MTIGWLSEITYKKYSEELCLLIADLHRIGEDLCQEAQQRNDLPSQCTCPHKYPCQGATGTEAICLMPVPLEFLGLWKSGREVQVAEIVAGHVQSSPLT